MKYLDHGKTSHYKVMCSDTGVDVADLQRRDLFLLSLLQQDLQVESQKELPYPEASSWSELASGYSEIEKARRREKRYL